MFKKEGIKFVEAKAAVNGYDTDKPAKYIADTPIYIVKYGEKYMELPIKTKELEKVFPEKASELKSFIKSNKIKLDKEQDLVKLANFLNI